jgi:hypothetical protein
MRITNNYYNYNYSIKLNDLKLGHIYRTSQNDLFTPVRADKYYLLNMETNRLFSYDHFMDYTFEEVDYTITIEKKKSQ